jgi:hypothetical protein
VLALAQDGLRPTDAQPGQILVESGFERGAAAGVIDVFDAQDKLSAPFLRRRVGRQRTESAFARS